MDGLCPVLPERRESLKFPHSEIRGPAIALEASAVTWGRTGSGVVGTSKRASTNVKGPCSVLVSPQPP